MRLAGSRPVVMVGVGGALCWAPGGGSGCLPGRRGHAQWLWSGLVALCVGLPVVIRGVERRAENNAPGSAPDRGGSDRLSRDRSPRPIQGRGSLRLRPPLAHHALRGPPELPRETTAPPHAGPTPALVVGIRAARAASWEWTAAMTPHVLVPRILGTWWAIVPSPASHAKCQCSLRASFLIGETVRKCSPCSCRALMSA